MAATGMVYGEHRFQAAYTARILAALGVLGVIVGLWAAQDDPSISSHPALFWISVGLAAALAVLWVALGKSALVVNDSGIRKESAFGSQEMAWSQVVETRYRVIPINVYAHFGLIGALVAMSSKSGRVQLALELVGQDRKRLKITSGYRRGDEAIGIILGRLLPPMVQNVKARIQRGETVPFGGLGLSATTVTWKGTSLPVSEIGKAGLVGSNLQIKRTGKWLNSISVRSDKVPDVLVFLEVLESLAPQIKSAGIDPLARVRV